MPAERGVARVGCSGWNYRDWRGIVYPETLPKSEWFTYYTALFDTVELNTTFYRLPSRETAEAWSEAAPRGFVYALKLGQFGSHRMKLLDAGTWLPNHVDRAQRLGASMGPTLVQLPPRWRRNAGRLDEFLAVAPTTMRWAVEIRDRSWLCDEIYAVLERRGAALCIHDLLDDHPFVMTTAWTYLRFHGPKATRDPYRGSYSASRLSTMANRVNAELDRGHDAYCYFNNDFDGLAVRDALRLREALHPRHRSSQLSRSNDTDRTLM